MLTATAIVLAASLAAAPARLPVCAEGKLISADTAGHCCWPMQVWSNSRQACLGTPACPAPLRPKGDGCSAVCENGLEASADTAGHCCWPGQAWAATRQQCVGVPNCPAGFHADNETCAVTRIISAPLPPPPLAPRPDTGPPPPLVAATDEPPPLVPAPPPPPPVATVVAPPADAPRIIIVAPAPPSDGPVALGLHSEKRFRVGMIVGGATMFVLGYAAAIVSGIVAGSYVADHPNNRCWAAVANNAAIPFAGPALAIAGQVGSRSSTGGQSCTSEDLFYPGIAVATVDTLLQVAGLTVFALGFILRSEELVPDEPHAPADDDVHASISFGAPSSLLGLSVRLTNW